MPLESRVVALVGSTWLLYKRHTAATATATAGPPPAVGGELSKSAASVDKNPHIVAFPTGSRAITGTGTGSGSGGGAGDPLSLIFFVQFVSLTGSMSNMPESFTVFADSLSWAMFRFDAPGVSTPTEDDDAAVTRRHRRRRRLGSDDDDDGGGDGLPHKSKVKRSRLAGTVFWNGLTLIGIVLGHVAYEYIYYRRGDQVPAAFAFPAVEIKLVTLSLPGMLSTSMDVMADEHIGAGYKCLGSLVVLGCLAFMGLCARVLHLMEKRKPVRFGYEENFPVGFKGEMSNFRDAPLKWKAFALLTYKSVKVGQWQVQDESFNEMESVGWDAEKTLLPAWVTVRLFGDPVRTSEQAAQFHRNWSPLYSKFRGDKGKINYVIEMAGVFMMCVFLSSTSGAAQAALIWLLNNATALYNGVVSPYSDNFASNSNELLMRVLKWTTMMLPLLAYGSGIDFQLIGNAMMNIQLSGLGCNCIFQLYGPVKGFLDVAFASMMAAKEEAQGLMPNEFELKVAGAIELPDVPLIGNEIAQEVLQSAAEEVLNKAQELAQEMAQTYGEAYNDAREEWHREEGTSKDPGEEEKHG